jgi:hypothetical protein
MWNFCLGREVHGIPSGLLIYAVGIEYSHWDEAALMNPVAVRVLDAPKDHYRTDWTPPIPALEISYGC